MRTILRDNYEPVMGAYHEVLLIDEAQNKRWLFDCDGVFTEIPSPGCVENEKGESETCAISQKAFTDEVNNLEGDLGDEIQARTDADDAIWAEIEEIEMSSDVVDIVGTYAELQQYDTSHLNNNDIIKVVADETHDGATSYYRFSESTDSFSYVGSEGPYYTESEVDTLLGGKQDMLTAGTNITITNNTISATDTTYEDFDGATSGTAGASGLVPAPAAGDEGKFLKGDGTWDDAAGSTYTAGNGINISNDVISVDNTVVQEKLTAGANITINNNTISATDTTYTAGTGISISPQNVISAASAGGTIFYYYFSDLSSASISFYSDSGFTDGVSIDDIYAAAQAGSVMLVGSDGMSIQACSILSTISSPSNSDYYLSFYVIEETTGGNTLYRVDSDGYVSSGSYSFDFVKTPVGGEGVTIFYYDYDAALAATSGDQISLYGSYEPSSGLDTSTEMDGDTDLYAPMSGKTSFVLVGIYEKSGSYYIKCADTVISSAGSENATGNTEDPYLSIIKDELQTRQVWKWEASSATSYDLCLFKSNLQGATYTAGTGISISAQNVISASPNNISANDWSGLWQ